MIYNSFSAVIYIFKYWY